MSTICNLCHTYTAYKACNTMCWKCLSRNAPAFSVEPLQAECTLNRALDRCCLTAAERLSFYNNLHLDKHLEQCLSSQQLTPFSSKKWKGNQCSETYFQVLCTLLLPDGGWHQGNGSMCIPPRVVPVKMLEHSWTGIFKENPHGIAYSCTVCSTWPSLPSVTFYQNSFDINMMWGVFCCNSS